MSRLPHFHGDLSPVPDISISAGSNIRSSKLSCSPIFGSIKTLYYQPGLQTVLTNLNYDRKRLWVLFLKYYDFSISSSYFRILSIICCKRVSVYGLNNVLAELISWFWFPIFFRRFLGLLSVVQSSE